MHLFLAFVLILSIAQFIKEAFKKPTPKGTRFDWDAYYKDIDNGIGAMEQVRKRQRGGYNTTKPIPDKLPSTDNKRSKNN